MRVISIVPRLPPAIDGVGDYALCLAQQLRQDLSIETHFIVCDPDWSGDAHLEGFSISQVEERSSQSLLRILSQESASRILLQFSGYGYAKRSCCFWLIDGLEKWRRDNSEARLITMFHEVYSNKFTMPWKSQFWASPIQRILAARLIAASEQCLTNIELHSRMLNSLCFKEDQEFFALPVFSNIGEPKLVLPLSKRKKRLIVFGQGVSRSKVYKENTKDLRQICNKLEISEIIDIGKPINIAGDNIGDVPLVRLGECCPDQISEIFQDSMAGFINYDPLRLSKSSIFAAYCSHGMLAINSVGISGTQDNMVAGKHYCRPEDIQSAQSLELFQAIADNSRDWYRSHSLRNHSLAFSRAFNLSD